MSNLTQAYNLFRNDIHVGDLININYASIHSEEFINDYLECIDQNSTVLHIGIYTERMIRSNPFLTRKEYATIYTNKIRNEQDIICVPLQWVIKV